MTVAMSRADLHQTATRKTHRWRCTAITRPYIGRDEGQRSQLRCPGCRAPSRPSPLRRQHVSVVNAAAARYPTLPPLL